MFESAGTAGHYRRLMQRQLSGSQKGKLYGQRAQAETVMSMLKRNLGDALRARSPRARRTEQRLKAITHDVMLPRRQYGGSRQSRSLRDLQISWGWLDSSGLGQEWGLDNECRSDSVVC